MSLNKKKGFEPIAVAGLILTTLLHAGAVVGIMLYRRSQAEAKPPPPPHSYVVAKLLRLGKPKDPKKMPNKIVPRAATMKKTGIDYTADASDAPSKKTKKDRDALLSDKMRSSLDKAALLAQAQQDIEAEGSPDGVAGGTAKSAKDGDAYMTRIADLWNRNWSLPAIIPRNVAKKLYVLVVLKINKKGVIQFPLKYDRKSGNAHFDNSIASAWRAISKIPIPPPDRFASILANGLPLKLNWKGLQ